MIIGDGVLREAHLWRFLSGEGARRGVPDRRFGLGEEQI